MLSWYKQDSKPTLQSNLTFNNFCLHLYTLW